MERKITVYKKIVKPITLTDIDRISNEATSINIRYAPSMAIDDQQDVIFYQITIRISVYNFTYFKSYNIEATYDFRVDENIAILRDLYHADTIDTISRAYLYAINTTIDEINPTLRSNQLFQDLIIQYHYTLDDVRHRAAAMLHSHRQ